MRRSKYIGLLAIGLGIVMIVGAAVLPVSHATERSGPFRIDVGNNNCGPAAYAAYRRAGTECGQAARNRLLATSAIGLLVVAVGMTLFAGGVEPRGSRIQVPTARVGRRSTARSPGSRGYKPG